MAELGNCLLSAVFFELYKSHNIKSEFLLRVY